MTSSSSDLNMILTRFSTRPFFASYRCVRAFVLGTMIGVVAIFQSSPVAMADGTPPDDFLNRLRDGKYFDIALTFLDRAKTHPGIDSKFLSSIELERAQTYIDKAFVSRSTRDRDQAFEDAESSLKKFLSAGSHPRASEARLRLGKIQMIRAAQYMSGEPDKEKRKKARGTYTRASETFGQIVEDLREKLKAMQGARVDAAKNPEQAKLRDQYKGEFLEAMINAGEAGWMAADTFEKPDAQQKKLLEDALSRFTDLSEKYSDYVQGAIAFYKRGRIEEKLGADAKALDSYLRMTDVVDAPELRDAKFMATAGLVRLAQKQAPDKPDDAIAKGEALLKTVRPNERKLAGVAEVQMEVAVVYLAKANRDGISGPDKKKARNAARQWLVKAAKIPGNHLPRVTQQLEDFGIDSSQEDQTLPTAEEPEDFEQGFINAQQLFAANLAVTKSLKEMPEGDKGKQRLELGKQIAENRAIAIILLRRSLTKINKSTDTNLVNEARNLLTYLLYQAERYHDTIAMGTMLCKQAPGSENGLRGGLFALNAMQMLLREAPSNQTFTSMLANHSEYLIATWPSDPKAAGAKNVMVALAMENRQWQKARDLIEKLDDGPPKAKSQRVLGNLLWVEANEQLRQEHVDEAKKLMEAASKELQRGLDAVKPGLADEKVMREAFVLSRVQLRLDDPVGALKTLDNDNYGATKLASKLGLANDQFASQLYSHELQAVVQSMTSKNANLDQLMTRASDAMDRLRESVTKSAGEQGSKKLAGIYLQLARSIREQLDTATPAKKAKLTSAFRVFLERVAKTTQDDETLLWIGQTLIQLAESGKEPGQSKITGPGTELLKTALTTFDKVSAERQATPQIMYQRAGAQRQMGDYGNAIKTYTELLQAKPMMIDAQMHAAMTYQLWAASLPPKFAKKSFIKAISGAKPNAKGKNIIWGWGRIGQLTNGREQFREEFFDSRYHLALCRFSAGKISKDQKLMKTSVSDIKKIDALFPEMGGTAQRAKFDALLKRIQKELGQQPTGLSASN